MDLEQSNPHLSGQIDPGISLFLLIALTGEGVDRGFGVEEE